MEMASFRAEKSSMCQHVHVAGAGPWHVVECMCAAQNNVSVVSFALVIHHCKDILEDDDRNKRDQLMGSRQGHNSCLWRFSTGVTNCFLGRDKAAVRAEGENEMWPIVGEISKSDGEPSLLDTLNGWFETIFLKGSVWMLGNPIRCLELNLKSFFSATIIENVCFGKQQLWLHRGSTCTCINASTGAPCEFG